MPAETAIKVTNDALQLHGAAGYPMKGGKETFAVEGKILYDFPKPTFLGGKMVETTSTIGTKKDARGPHREEPVSRFE